MGGLEVPAFTLLKMLLYARLPKRLATCAVSCANLGDNAQDMTRLVPHGL